MTDFSGSARDQFVTITREDGTTEKCRFYANEYVASKKKLTLKRENPGCNITMTNVRPANEQEYKMINSNW